MNSKVLFSRLAVLSNRLFKKQNLIIAAVASIILIFTAVYMADKDADNRYEVLFDSLTSADAAKVIEELEKNSTPYELLDNNIIKVPKNALYKERMAIASLGIIKESPVGFKLFDNNKFSEADFWQNAKKIRILEEELSRTINALTEIEDATVHLALQKNTTALVLLQLAKERSLSLKQIRGIKNLVAAAVPNLVLADVILIGNNREIFGSEDEIEQLNSLSTLQQNFKVKEEKKKQRKIIDLISPYVGGEKKVAAHVNIDFDFFANDSFSNRYDSGFAQIKKIMTTVIVDGNYRYKSDAEGNLKDKVNYEPLLDSDLETISLLVSRSIGIDKERGDEISVKNVEFKIAEIDTTKNEVNQIALFYQKYLAPFSEFFKYIFVFALFSILYIKFIALFVKRASEVSKEKEESVGVFFERGNDEIKYTKELLYKALDAKDADKISEKLSKTVQETQYFSYLSKIKPQQLSKLLIDEHPQTIALILAHMDAADAAYTLEHFSDDLRGEVLIRIAKLGDISSSVVKRVSDVLKSKLELSLSKIEIGGICAVAAIFNSFDKKISKETLVKIQEQDKEVSALIEDKIVRLGLVTKERVK